MEAASFTGFENGYGFSSGHGSPSNIMSGPGYSNAFSHQENTSYDTYAHAMHNRLDSLTSLSPSCQAQSTDERQQAELQPRAAATPETPHTTYVYSQGSQAMSRGPSKLSNQSSASFRPQHGSVQSFSPLDRLQNDYSPVSSHMQRSFSDRQTIQGHSFDLLSPIPQPYPFSFDSFTYSPIHPLSTGLPITPQCSPLTSYFGESRANPIPDQPPTLGVNEAIGQYFGQTIPRHPNHLKAPVAQFRRRTKSDTHTLHRPLPVALLSTSHVQTSLDSVCPASTTSEITPPERQTKRRRGRPASLSDTDTDPIAGHVLASGQFQCAKEECADLRFGRQADFRRHWTNVHAKSKIEWFCTEEGCDRSRRPLKKVKGRSFGARKDKMEEHVSTVHFKDGKKKKKPFEPETDEEGEEYYEDDEDGLQQAKTPRCS